MASERFNGVQAFVATVETGSFTLAAERLHLSRSAVGKAVSKLEARLAIRLLQRSTRRLTLTQDGAVFYESCLRALTELESADNLLGARRGDPAGTVRIEMPVLFGRHWVMPVVLELMDRYPALRFDVSLSNRVSNLLGEGVDVAVGIGRLTDSTDLVARALGTQKTVLCAAPSYLTRKGRPLSPDDLADHELIVERAGHSWSVRDAHGHVCEVPGCNRLHCHDMGAALDATFAGGGIARLPAWLAMPHIASGRLEVVLPKIDAGSLPIHIVWPRNRQLMARTRAVIDALLAYCVPVAPWAAVPGMTQSG